MDYEICYNVNCPSSQWLYCAEVNRGVTLMDTIEEALEYLTSYKKHPNSQLPYIDFNSYMRFAEEVNGYPIGTLQPLGTTPTYEYW